MANILVISFSPLARDPRVTRQVIELAKCHKVTVAGFGRIRADSHRNIDLSFSRRSLVEKIQDGRRMALGAHEAVIWSRPYMEQLMRQVSKSSYDLVVANDVNALPAAYAISQERCPVLLDAHEYTPDEVPRVGASNALLHRHNNWLCKTYLPLASGSMTVSQPIADKYMVEFGISQPIVIPNAAPYAALEPGAVNPRRIRLLYHGIVAPARGLRILLKAIERLPKHFELTLMLMGQGRQIQTLKKTSKGDGRVEYVDPVKTYAIPRVVNAYDIGVYALQPATFNERSALPNKFFENVQARVGQLVTPTSEMSRLVRDHNIGLVSEGFDAASIASALGGLTSDQISQFKAEAHRSARELSWENFAHRLHQLIQEHLP